MRTGRQRVAHAVAITMMGVTSVAVAQQDASPPPLEGLPSAEDAPLIDYLVYQVVGESAPGERILEPVGFAVPRAPDAPGPHTAEFELVTGPDRVANNGVIYELVRLPALAPAPPAVRSTGDEEWRRWSSPNLRGIRRNARPRWNPDPYMILFVEPDIPMPLNANEHEFVTRDAHDMGSGTAEERFLEICAWTVDADACSMMCAEVGAHLTTGLTTSCLNAFDEVYADDPRTTGARRSLRDNDI